jgi:hypothetical protein
VIANNEFLRECDFSVLASLVANWLKSLLFQPDTLLHKLFKSLAMSVSQYAKNKKAVLCVLKFTSQVEEHDANNRTTPTEADSGTKSVFAPGSLMCIGFPDVEGL